MQYIFPILHQKYDVHKYTWIAIHLVLRHYEYTQIRKLL